MMKILFENEWRIMMNTIRTQPSRNLFAYLISVIVIGLFLIFISNGVWYLAGKMTTPIFEGILSYSLLMVIGITVLFGLPYVYKNLYASTDLELLFTMPIPTPYIFWIKYIQSFLRVALPILFFFGVLAMVYGLATGVHFLYYPVLLLVLIAVSLIGLSITYLGNLLVIQIVPASRANEFLTGMSFLTGIAVYVLLMIPNFTSDISITEMMMSGLPLLPDWIPTNWGSAAVIEAGQGSIQFIIPLLMILFISAILILIATMTVEKGFRTGWIRVSEGGGGKKKKRHWKKRRSLKLDHPVIAIGKKEWLTLKRDTREWLVFMPLVISIGFIIIGFFTSDGSINELRQFPEISWSIAQGFALFLYAMLNGTVAAYSVGREGVSAWHLNILPLPGKTIALGKLWISWLIPFVLLTTVEVIVGVFLGWSVTQFLLGIVVKVVITLGISALGLWFGTIGAKYNPMNPQMRLQFGVSILLFILSIIYLVVLAIPYGLMVFPVEQVALPEPTSHGVSGIPGLIVTIIMTIFKWKQAYPMVVSVGLVLLMILISVGITVGATLASAKRFDKGIKIDLVSETNSKPLNGK